MQDCYIRNGAPLTTNDHYTLADLDPPVQRMVLEWIADNILPGNESDEIHHGTLKHQMEYDIGVYVSGNQFKDAMLKSGYVPLHTDSVPILHEKVSSPSFLAAP